MEQWQCDLDKVVQEVEKQAAERAGVRAVEAAALHKKQQVRTPGVPSPMSGLASVGIPKCAPSPGQRRPQTGPLGSPGHIADTAGSLEHGEVRPA